MAYEIKRDKDGKVVIYKDGKKLGGVKTQGDETKKEDEKKNTAK